MNIRQLPVQTMLGNPNEAQRQPPLDGSRNPVNYEEKYKKALKSIEDIIKANKQIKDELDSLRTMRQTEIDSLTMAQREQFKKAYDALLKEKNALVINLQSLELENQKLKCTITELQNQVSIYKAEKFTKVYGNRDSFEPSQAPDIRIVTPEQSPKPEERDLSRLLKEKEAEFHRTLQNYEQHHSNLARTNKRLEERLGELETKIINTEKNYKNKLENKELEVIDIKALTRQEFTEQIAALRKQNSSLKIANNELLIKIQSMEKNGPQIAPQKFDWETDLIQEMIAVKSNLEPLRQQISELQELNIYEKEQSIREKTNLRTQVLELESEVERQNETIKSLEKKIVESHQEKITLEEKCNMMRKLQEENQLLQGKVIVMESREVALRNRTGEELEERVLEFENRVELLLSNKEGLKELKEVNIHQLLALKAYIMELDGKIRELLNSNNYLTKKYKSYKQKYQNSLKEYKHYEMTINSLKMKILGYDKLVLKLQEELEFTVRSNEQEIIQITTNSKPNDENSELYRKKYELLKEKLQIQEKYKVQEFQTLKLSYETKIMELTIQVEEIRSLKDTLELYRSKNEELQMVLTKKDNELYESKRLSSLKASNIEEQPATTRQTKDIINNLHITIKQSDETIFKLQTDLRTKEDNYKRTITKLERQIEDLKDEQSRDASKKQIEKTLQFQQEIKKYKLKITDLEHQLHLLQVSHSDQYSKKTDDFDFKLRQLQVRVQEAEEQREEEIFGKRRLEKQVLGLTLDKEELQATVQELESRISQLKRQNDDLRDQPSSSMTFTSFKQDYGGSMEFELQSKDNIIRKLNSQITELRNSAGESGEKDITIGSLKNEIFYLKKEIDDLNDVINKYTNEITFLKGHLDTNKTNFNSGLEVMLEEKDNLLNKARKETSSKEFKIRELEDEISRLEETIRKMRKDLNQLQYLKQENDNLQRTVTEKNSFAQRLKYQSTGYEQDVDRLNREITYLKENVQKLNYDLLQRDDQISKLNLELSTLSVKNKQQLDSRFTEELQNKERQYNKLNSDYLALKSTVTLVEEDKTYHQQNYRRANGELMNIRTQYNMLQDENSSLSEQLYKKSQELSKLQFSIQSLEGQVDEYGQKDEELYKLRNQLFALRTSNSALEDEIYSKEGNINRAVKELNYMKEQYGELEQELKIKQETINRLNYELNNLRRSHDEDYQSLQEKDMIINRLNIDLTNNKNKYNQLEEEMEQRQQQISSLTQEINQFKVDMTYHQDDASQKVTQITRLSNEREILRSEIMRLNEEITDKNMQINKLKQEIFAIRIEISQNQYDKQLKAEQETITYKNKINMLEHQIEDRDNELRRLTIELETSRYKPGSHTPEITEEEMQGLREQITKRQRELIAMKFQLDDKQFQFESAQSTLGLLKNTVSELQYKMEADQQSYEQALRDANLRQRKANQEINLMRDDIERLQAQSKVEKPKSYSISYSEEEMNAIQERLSQKQIEVNSLRNQLQEREFYIQSMNSKVQMQQNLIKQLEVQAHQDLSRAENEIQEFIQRERTFRETLAQLEQAHHEELIAVQNNQKTILTQQTQGGQYNMQEVLQAHIQEIDRLNRIVKDLEEELRDFKLKLSSMVNQQNRIEQNLVTMVLLFGEIEALRDRMKIKETEINEVRKSFIQMTVAGEIEANKMSRLLAISKQEQESHERLDYESKSDVSVPIEDQHLIEDFRKEQNPAVPFEDKGFRKEENQYYFHPQTVVPSHEIVSHQERQEIVMQGNQQYRQYHQFQPQPERYEFQTQTNQREVYGQPQTQLQQIESPGIVAQTQEIAELQPQPHQIIMDSGLARQQVQEDVEPQQQINPAPPMEVRSEPPAAIPEPDNIPEGQVERKIDITGSLINELQKEPQKPINQSQTRAGQIIIKIPSSSQASLSRSLASQPHKMMPGYVQGGQPRIAGPQQIVQVQRHSQHIIQRQVVPQQFPYQSQGMVPQHYQHQVVRISPGGPIQQSVSPVHRPPQY